MALLRTHGNDGHSPMFGIAMNPIGGREYPAIIGAIAVTLVGGLVLGPEVAMVATGAVVGTAITSRCGMATKQGAVIGASAAIFALFVGPIITGSFTVLTSYHFSALDLIGSIGVAAAAAGVLTAGRFLSIGMITLRGGDRPSMLVLACAGLLVGVLALGYRVGTGHEVALVLTSGESYVKELLALGTASAIGVTVAAKWLAHSVSMGAGSAAARSSPRSTSVPESGGLRR